MKLSHLKKIIKESLEQIQTEQNVQFPTGGSSPSCFIPGPQIINGPFPTQFNPAVWTNKWETFKDNNNLGCQWVKNKYLTWKHKLNDLHQKPYPKCNRKWQAMLTFKLKHVDTMHSNCVI
tara:strand:+ start:52 stop:411 length:360 start_codon:yes stop_codon:yes gene_type:complete